MRRLTANGNGATRKCIDVIVPWLGGKLLHCSTHKQRCPERDTCPYWAEECERKVEGGFVSHLVFSSEPLLGDNVWEPMRLGEMIGVDWRMQMEKF